MNLLPGRLCASGRSFYRFLISATNLLSVPELRVAWTALEACRAVVQDSQMTQKSSGQVVNGASYLVSTSIQEGPKGQTQQQRCSRMHPSTLPQSRYAKYGVQIHSAQYLTYTRHVGVEMRAAFDSDM